jgi:hypothetical protein
MATQPTAANIRAYRTLMDSIDRTDAQLRTLDKRTAKLEAELARRGISLDDMEGWDLVDGRPCKVRRVYDRARRCMVTEVVS